MYDNNINEEGIKFMDKIITNYNTTLKSLNLYNNKRLMYYSASRKLKQLQSIFNKE